MSDVEFSPDLPSSQPSADARGVTSTHSVARTQTREALFQRLEDHTAEEGHFEPVGQHHWALFEDRGPVLIVTFEQLETILGSETGLPWGHAISEEHGWSHLCLIADGETWYRDPAVYRHLDRLVDDTFFEDFDKVLFYGYGLGAHAACAFAVCAPGANVLALNPCATFAGTEVRWDRRALKARRLDFTSRFGYAPDMLEGAGKVVVIHDLTLPEESGHSALFRAPWVTRLSTPLTGDCSESALRQMGVLPQLIDDTMEGRVTRASFAKLWRNRRSYAPYLRALLDKAEKAGRKSRAIAICRSAHARLGGAEFSAHLAKLIG